MRTKLHIAVLSLLSTGAIAQDQQLKSIESFTSMQTSGAVNVRYRNSDTLELMIKGSFGDFDKVDYYTKDNTLYISSHGNINDPMTIYVSGNKLQEIDAAGASSVRCSEPLTVEQFQANASGASNVSLNLKATSVKAIVTGASEMNLKGSAKNLNAVTTGASSLKSYDMASDSCHVNASGASSAKVFASKTIVVYATGASTVKFKGDPQQVSAEGSTASKIVKVAGDGVSSSSTAKSDSTKKSETRFTFKNKEIIIIENEGYKPYDHNYYNSNYTRKHWQGFWIGIGGYTNPSVGFTMDPKYKYMELDYGRSFNFQWNLAQQNLNLYKKYIQLSSGVGLQFSNLSFDNKTRLNADTSFTWGYIDSSNTYSYRKNRFKQAFVTVPLLLNFNTSKRLSRNFHITMGIVGKYQLGARTKQVLVQNSNQFTLTRKDDYNINPFQFDGYASVGYRNFTVFGQYALTELFRKNRGPQVFPFAVGLRLIPFD